MSRKTFEIEKLKEYANTKMTENDSEWSNPSVRKAIFDLVERVLFDTDNYRGFNYVKWLDEGGYEQWVKDGKPRDNAEYLGDKTRVRFY